MKFIAKQVPPEYQESPLFYGDEFFENIICDGNRDYMSRTTRTYDIITKYIDDACYDYQNKLTNTITEILQQYGFEKRSGKRWSPSELHMWKLIFSGEYSEENTITNALNLLTAGNWECHTIRGYCQGDWQDIYYNTKEYSKNDIELFTIEYFNMGEEWIIHPDDDEEETTSIYTHNEPRAEIAEAFGVALEDIELYLFDGFTKIAKYKLAE